MILAILSWPRSTVKDLGLASIVNVVTAAALTVRLREVWAVSELVVALIDNVNVPVVAVGLAVSVNTLDPVKGFGLNEAVTPVGSPEMFNGTLPGDPFT
jgi:hypothetical protein